MYQNFQEVNGLDDKHQANDYSKYCFYCGLLQMYNSFSQSMKMDPTLKTTSMFSEAVRQDLEAFFTDLETKRTNKVN